MVTVLATLISLIADRSTVLHTLAMTIPSTTARACRRKMTDSRVAFQFGVWRAFGTLANNAIVSILGRSVRAHRSHPVDAVVIGQGRVLLALRIRPPNTFAVLQGVFLRTFGLGRVVNVTPALKKRLSVRAFSVDGLRPTNIAIPAHPLGKEANAVVRLTEGSKPSREHLPPRS